MTRWERWENIEVARSERGDGSEVQVEKGGWVVAWWFGKGGRVVR